MEVQDIYQIFFLVATRLGHWVDNCCLFGRPSALECIGKPFPLLRKVQRHWMTPMLTLTLTPYYYCSQHGRRPLRLRRGWPIVSICSLRRNDLVSIDSFDDRSLQHTPFMSWQQHQTTKIKNISQIIIFGASVESRRDHSGLNFFCLSCVVPVTGLRYVDAIFAWFFWLWLSVSIKIRFFYAFNRAHTKNAKLQHFNTLPTHQINGHYYLLYNTHYKS